MDAGKRVRRLLRQRHATPLAEPRAPDDRPLLHTPYELVSSSQGIHLSDSIGGQPSSRGSWDRGALDSPTALTNIGKSSSPQPREVISVTRKKTANAIST